MDKRFPHEAHSWSIGQRIRYMREHQNWSQTRLAQELDKHDVRVSISSINRWENDKVFPGPYYREMLCTVFCMDTKDLFGLPEGLAEKAEKKDPPLLETEAVEPIWNVPYLRNHYFTGRELLIARLHELLTAPKVGTLTALCGLGGIGKTQVAVEYAYRYMDAYEAVLWVRAETPQTLSADFVRLATLLHLPEKDEKDERLVIAAVQKWLHTHQHWLLIMDNVDDLEQVAEFLPRRGKGQTLLTTRSNATGSNIRGIELDTLKPEEGALLTLRRAKILSDDHALNQATTAVQKNAQCISELLGGLPLALDQAGAYIEENQCSVAEYLALYPKRTLDFLKRQGNIYHFSYPYTVATTWNVSFARLEQTHPGAADLLRLCAFLTPNMIPEVMLLKARAELGPVLDHVISDPLAWNEAIGALRRYSLVRRIAETGMINIHQLVQIMLKETMDPDTYRQWAGRALKVSMLL